MISDTLSDAAAEIRDYQQRMPEVYGPIRPEIDRVLRAMDRLRVYLDRPPLTIPSIKEHPVYWTQPRKKVTK